MFWRIITRFGQLPFICVPLLLIGVQVYTATSNIHESLIWMRLSGLTIFCSYAGGSIIKFLYFKPRPQPQPYSTRWQKIDASSFPSIHTSNSFILAFWGILSWIWFHWDSLRTPATISIFLARTIFFICVSRSRVVLKKHYKIDLFGGVCFGLLCIWIIYLGLEHLVQIAMTILSYMLF